MPGWIPKSSDAKRYDTEYIQRVFPFCYRRLIFFSWDFCLKGFFKLVSPEDWLYFEELVSQQSLYTSSLVYLSRGKKNKTGLLKHDIHQSETPVAWRKSSLSCQIKEIKACCELAQAFDTPTFHKRRTTTRRLPSNQRPSGFILTSEADGPDTRLLYVHLPSRCAKGG